MNVQCVWASLFVNILSLCVCISATLCFHLLFTDTKFVLPAASELTAQRRKIYVWLSFQKQKKQHPNGLAVTDVNPFSFSFDQSSAQLHLHWHNPPCDYFRVECAPSGLKFVVPTFLLMLCRLTQSQKVNLHMMSTTPKCFESDRWWNLRSDSLAW